MFFNREFIIIEMFSYSVVDEACRATDVLLITAVRDCAIITWRNGLGWEMGEMCPFFFPQNRSKKASRALCFIYIVSETMRVLN